jgi:hypothetical protein
MNKEHLIEIQKVIEFCQVSIKVLLNEVYAIEGGNSGWCSHYPIECERQLMLMNTIIEFQIRDIKLPHKISIETIGLPNE